ncbi:hypothetical protein [Pedobacter alpinus]|uniref:Uncharacterized protein n=1 Tax=Pedobacter alpinus TaxID=1590643 RepID=A0ABW5TPF3_9SPHI
MKNINRSLKIVACLMVLFFFLGCKKESTCKNVVQGDWELVP